jgi:predicted GIY-YIG superfamily endonuclease
MFLYCSTGSKSNDMPINSTKLAFTSSNINSVPQSAGVYALYDGGLVVIYYGMSESDIKARLLAHYNGTSGNCHRSATLFNYELTKSAASRESALVAEFKMAYKKLPKCNEVHP